MAPDGTALRPGRPPSRPPTHLLLLAQLLLQELHFIQQSIRICLGQQIPAAATGAVGGRSSLQACMVARAGRKVGQKRSKKQGSQGGKIAAVQVRLVLPGQGAR